MVARAFRRLGALTAVVVLAPAVTYVIYGSVYGSIYGHATVWHQIAHAIVIAVGLFLCQVVHDRLDPQVRR